MRSIPKVVGLPWTMRKYDRVLFLSSAKNFERFFDHLVAAATGYRGARVVPNGTEPDPDRGSPADFRNRFGLNGKFVVLCVANYSTRKNQELAVSVFREARLDNAALVFIGSEFNDYSRAVVRLDRLLQQRFPKGDVLLLEKLDRRDTLAGIAACDLFLLTAKAETQPISLLEAMAAGRPFLSTDTGCVRELPGGLIARRRSGLVSTLRRLFHNRKLREDLGRKGHEAVLSTFAQDKVRQDQLQILREMTPIRSQASTRQ
jgi:glycosyltransferase involved in cell wall biosynthesis